MKVWFSRTHIAGATRWHDEIGRALKRCDWFIVLLTPDSVRSRWVKREVVYALQHSQYDQHIVPVILRTCRPERLSWVLDQLEFVDFVRRFERGFAELLRIWGMSAKSRRRSVR